MFARKFALHRERFDARLLRGRRSEEFLLVCLKIPLLQVAVARILEAALFVFIN